MISEELKRELLRDLILEQLDYARDVSPTGVSEFLGEQGYEPDDENDWDTLFVELIEEAEREMTKIYNDWKDNN